MVVFLRENVCLRETDYYFSRTYFKVQLNSKRRGNTFHLVRYLCSYQRETPCVMSLALFIAQSMGELVSIPNCHTEAKSTHLELTPTKYQRRLYPGSDKQTLTCWEMQQLDHLNMGELVSTFKTSHENYTVCKKHISCSFTSEYQVPPMHQGAIRNKRFTEKFNSVANSYSKSNIPKVAWTTWQLWNKTYNQAEKWMELCT